MPIWGKLQVQKVKLCTLQIYFLLLRDAFKVTFRQRESLKIAVSMGLCAVTMGEAPIWVIISGKGIPLHMDV